MQSAGKLPLDVATLGVDLLAISGHKFCGPKGTGALWIRRGTRLVPQMTGGRQERSRRAGTENVPALVGLGVAATRARTRLGDIAQVAALRDTLERELLAAVPATHVNGRRDPRVANTSNIGSKGIEAESLVIASTPKAAVSTGSACSSGTLEPSHVLKAMGLDPHDTRTQSASASVSRPPPPTSRGWSRSRRAGRAPAGRHPPAPPAAAVTPPHRAEQLGDHACRGRDVGRRGFGGRRRADDR